MANITPLKLLIKTFTNRSVEEPPAEAVALYASHYSKMFDEIGYIRSGIKNFDRILDFMARYQIAKDIPCNLEVYETQLKGKKFETPKGLILFGPPGTGKTLAARIIAERFNLTIIDTHTIGMAYLATGGENWINDFASSNMHNAIIIDDIGAEGDLKKYGNESPMRAIFTARARYWDTYGTPTIYTTNIATSEEIADFYNKDQRLLDRLSAYQVGVEFTGASLRR